MNNQNAIQFFQELAQTDIDISATKINKCNDFTSIDAEFILKYSNKNSKILDLATGTGLCLNKYYNKVGLIFAVEKFKKFSDFIVKSPNIKIFNDDIRTFQTDEKFDIILMFGLMHYFNKEEATEVYKKYKNFLTKDGKLLIKQQFGIKDDVTVDGYSKELKCNYYSQYRQIDKEIDLLKELNYKNIEFFDIYPQKANRWDNTHFYAIKAEI